MKVLLAFFLWLGVFLFWFIVSRDHHPTLLIDALATVILVLASAAAFYTHDLVLRPRLWGRSHRGRYAEYAAYLLLVIGTLDLGAVLLIQTMYDRLWGPDPARFGFGTNVLYEALFITIHLIAGIAAVKIIRRKRS